MGYLHIDNLYKCQDILMFRECYALEKVHGTSAHVAYRRGTPKDGLRYFPGGVSEHSFQALFDHDALLAKFAAQFPDADEVTVYGEAYGGSCQKMSHTYGIALQFIVFDVQVGDVWLSVPQAEAVAQALGLEFVPYLRISTDVTALDTARDMPSEVAKRRGITEPRPSEGVVLRPLIELRKNNGDRIIVKHKGEAFKETTTARKVDDPAKLAVLADAQAIADEWVTEQRLTHVLDKLPHATSMEYVRDVMAAMVADIVREAAGEIQDSKDARRAIERRTALLFKQALAASIANA